jgi:hypothetical protein
MIRRPKQTDIGGEVGSVLYVGNSFLSFNNGIGWHVSRLHASANPAKRLRATSVAITGGGLDWHDVESYFRPKAFGSYSFDAANNVVFNDLERLFDVVLMMDCSQCPIHPQLKATFRASAKRHSETVRRHDAKPAFLMTWAYQDRPQMTAELAEAYTSVGNDNDALVIPVGLTFAAAVERRSELSLHMDDKSHPTLAGTYLAACTVYAALFRRSPIGLAHVSDLDAATAHFLQSVAVETVEGYYRTGETSSEP